MTGAVTWSGGAVSLIQENVDLAVQLDLAREHCRYLRRHLDQRSQSLDACVVELHRLEARRVWQAWAAVLVLVAVKGGAHG